MEKKTNLVRFGRNALSLFKRFQMACHHKDESEILNALLNLMEEGVWSLCVISFAVCLVAGFFKPHCFVLALASIILMGMVRANIEDRKKLNKEEC